MTNTKPGIVFVTGASSGFGAAVARRFAADGARVIVSARRADRVRELAAELGPQVLPLALDVRDRTAVAAAVAGLPSDFAAVDLLVNNAGLALGLNPAQDADLDEWDQMIDTNCKGLVYCTRAILPGMVARRTGHVISLGSVAGSYPYPGGNVYGGTKAFVHQFSLNLRSDLHGTGVRVTSIEPGMADTEFSLTRFSGDRAKADAVYAGMQPLTPDDIAESIHWAATQPGHVNVNTIELMPTAQSFAPFQVARDGVLVLPEQVLAAVGERRQRRADGLDQAQIGVGHGHPRRRAQVTADHAERVDQHRPAHAGRRPGRLLRRIGHLADGGDPDRVLDRAGAQQRHPVLLLEQARLPGGADRDQRGAADRERPGQFREPDVVADLQPHRRPRERGHDHLAARRDQVGFALAERVE
jgi:3-hydroxy acid dehydrogenase / malonic semialdehyde reductase